MSVNVRIKQKSLFNKKLDIDKIIKLTNLSYGICDENYRLITNEKAEHTLLFDENKLARGIDVSLEKSDIVLMLNLPTSSSEIITFYEVIAKICQELKIQNYIREEEQVNLSDNEKFIEYDEEASVSGLENIQEAIVENEYKRLEIFGICNPISIGITEVKMIGNNLDRFEDYLHRIQSLDVYYAVPGVYKVKEKLVGIYAIGSNIASVVPIEPYVILNQIQGIEEWYVMSENRTIKYTDFINNVNKKEYYDANHVIVTLSDDEIAMLLDKYSVSI